LYDKDEQKRVDETFKLIILCCVRIIIDISTLLQESLIMMLRHFGVVIMLMSLPHVSAFYRDASEVETTSVNDKIYNERMIEAMTKISLQLDAFNSHYATKLEDKFVNIIQMLSTLDANVKQLQEKAQVWDIFRHHITSWSENIKSSDQKIEILRKTMENLPVIENQLQNTDFKIQHIFEKTNAMSEKLHELSKELTETRKPKQKPLQSQKGPRNWSQEDFEQTEILIRLSKIQRTLQSTCSSIRLGKEFEELKVTSTEMTDNDTVSSLKALITKVNNNLEKIPIKELKQTHNLSKKNEKALEGLSNAIEQIDERTIRIFDASSYQFKKLISCCKSSEHEIVTFTNNADTLLKRTENSLKLANTNCNSSSSRVTMADEIDGSGGDNDEEDETGKIEN
jgi:archaellum component FlaC